LPPRGVPRQQQQQQQRQAGPATLGQQGLDPDAHPFELPPPLPPPPPPPQPPDAEPDAGLTALRAAMEADFTAAEVVELLQRTKARKAVVGPAAPWLLRPAAAALAPLLAAEFNAWRRVGALPFGDARSSIALVPKPGGAPKSPADLRGIAVGSLLAKLFAAGLERRASTYAEAAGTHADGQYGFRRQRSTEQAILALRTVIESYRLRRQRGQQPASARRRPGQLWVCFVDFKQAYDRVPREQLWAQLEKLGYGGEWLRAVRALYSDVPMTVAAPGLEGRYIHASQGLKQGCPLSPTLFALYIADWEQRVLDAAAHGMQLDLPELAGLRLPPFAYADDLALLATSAAGLQRQIDLLQQYCTDRGLTVNLAKTKIMLLAGADSEDQASGRVQRAGFTYARKRLEGTCSFKYLGVVFHCTQPLGESAAEARTAVARYAAAMFEGRCAHLGLEASRLLLQVYSQMVDSSLCYGAAVWAPGLALAAAKRQVVGGSGYSPPETLHHRMLRRLLGLPWRAPIATILAEAGQTPLHISWLVRAARFWNSLLDAPAGSITHAVVEAGLQMAADSAGLAAAQLPWLAQLSQAMAAAGVAFDPAQREALSPAIVRSTALRRYQQQVATAAQQDGASQLHHYFVRVRPECLAGPAAYCIAPYLVEVRERRRRLALTELRTGVHWGAESQERIRGPARRPAAERICPHCAAAGLPEVVEDTRHMVFSCTLYSGFRSSYPHLFTRAPPRRVPPLEPAGTPLQPPSQLAPLLWLPPTHHHQPPASPPPPPPPPPAAPTRPQPGTAGGGGGAGVPPSPGAAITTLTEFFGGPAVDLASFCGSCRRLGRQRVGLPP